MKHIILILSCFVFTLEGFSQNIYDALLFSQESNLGSARYNGLSGAFGALGGDVSAINNNPASSAVLKHSIVDGTLSYNSNNNSTDYYNTITNNYEDNINLSQVGGVYVLKNTDDGNSIKKVTLGLNYQQIVNNNNDIDIIGNGPNSISSFFLNYANGIPFGDIQILPGEFIEEAYLNIGSQLGYNYQQAFLGYYGGVIDPITLDNTTTTYQPTGSYSGSLSQRQLSINTGQIGKINFNLATELKHDLYLGANLNWHPVFLERVTLFSENNYAPTSNLSYVDFNNYLRTTGSGFSFQVGAIKKIGDALRLGASYQSPTWYFLIDELSQSINSNLADSEIGYINTRLVNIFPEYRMRTPSKLTGSAAILFGKKGLISFDYYYKDFSNVRLLPSSRFYDVNDNQIIPSFRNTSSISIGGEYRIQDWSLRGGYSLEQSPFNDQNIESDMTGYSAGIGYSFGQVKLDFSYNRFEKTQTQQLYSEGLTDTAKINNVNTNVSATVSYKF